MKSEVSICLVNQEDSPGYFILWGPTPGTPLFTAAHLMVSPFLDIQLGTTHTFCSSRTFDINKRPGSTQAGPTCKGLKGSSAGTKSVRSGDWREHHVCYL